MGQISPTHFDPPIELWVEVTYLPTLHGIKVIKFLIIYILLVKNICKCKKSYAFDKNICKCKNSYTFDNILSVKRVILLSIYYLKKVIHSMMK